MMGGLLIVLILGAALFIGSIVLLGVLVGKGAMRWHHNNQQPIQTLPAVVVTKRTRVSGSRNSGSHTSYYATFELQSGERREFLVPGDAYGQLAERDQGQLTFQGTRFHGYARGWLPAGPAQQSWQ
ncbi:MAG TPA: DUF2500 domain-containing protein [Herpetosiphonaceae bacterium]|nr:DUF2500 domain-containing protein [Herpetosiphonaceae bacterium]